MIRWDQDVEISWKDSSGNKWNGVLGMSFTADKHIETGWGVTAEARELKEAIRADPEGEDIEGEPVELWPCTITVVGGVDDDHTRV